MRRFHVSLCLALVLQLLLCPLAAIAGQIKCNTNQAGNVVEVTGSTITSKVGTTATKSDVVITSNRLDVLFSSADLTEKDSGSGGEQRESRLSGVLFGCKTEGSQRKILTGFCHFGKGSQINELQAPGVDDTVTTSNGETCTGHITSVTREQLTMETKAGTQQIPVENITNVSSPCVFKVSMNLSAVKDTDSGFEGDAATVSFKETCTVKAVKPSTTSSTSTSVSTSDKSTLAKKILIGTLVLGVVATAITLPIVIPLATHRHHNNNGFEQRLFLENLRIRQIQESQTRIEP